MNEIGYSVLAYFIAGLICLALGLWSGGFTEEVDGEPPPPRDLLPALVVFMLLLWPAYVAIYVWLRCKKGGR